MRKTWRRWLACLCAAALVVCLCVPALADEVTVYHTALNDKLLDLNSETMPALVGGAVYVPYSVFDRDASGVDLGVSYGQKKTDTDYTLTLYSAGGMLVFDLNRGTCEDGSTGESKNMKAVLRNGRVYVPLGGVCSFFGLKSSFTPTSYGTLVRITNGGEGLTTTQFVYAATSQMRDRYNKYVKNQTAQASPTPQATPTPTPAPTPALGEDEGPDKSGVRVYLGFQCTDGGGLGAILDSLERSGVYALFLFRPEDLARNSDWIRRMVGSGHAVGLIADGATADERGSELREGARLLERIARARPHTVLLEGAGAADELAGEGWARWTPSVDGLPDGRGQLAQANAILAAVDAKRTAAYVAMDDSAVSANLLTRVLSGLRQENYSIRLPVETEL